MHVARTPKAPCLTRQRKENSIFDSPFFPTAGQLTEERSGKLEMDLSLFGEACASHLQVVMPYIIMAYIVMAYIVMAYIVMAYIVMAY